jgi:hypothetical protein
LLQKYISQTFKSNMNAEMYRQIIEEHIFPFCAHHYNYGANLHQDNDSKHISRLCQNALKDLNINWVCMP